jgi:hypothetical protein
VSRLRLTLAIGGFVLALFSVALNETSLGWGAVALLIMSFVVRLIQRKRGNRTLETER